MRPFTYERIAEVAGGVQLAGAAGSVFLAGGTNLLDLMKIGVAQPDRLIDISGLRAAYAGIDIGPEGVAIGALARMADVAGHAVLQRDYPVLTQSLQQAASAQLRNMASIAGTVLQRTRCNYFRDPSWRACNKRVPGSGCAAIAGNNRHLAVLGTSAQCIAHYPGDFANALVALGATVDIVGADGARTIPVDELHVLPGEHPEQETTLRAGELITRFHVPAGPWARRSLYRKIRDRESYAFALSSAAVAMHLEAGRVVAVRIGLGGMATKPWRAHAAEAVLTGAVFSEEAAVRAAEAAFAEAVTYSESGFKPELGRRTLVRALLDAAALEV